MRFQRVPTNGGDLLCYDSLSGVWAPRVRAEHPRKPGEQKTKSEGSPEIRLFAIRDAHN